MVAPCLPIPLVSKPGRTFARLEVPCSRGHALGRSGPAAGVGRPREPTRKENQVQRLRIALLARNLQLTVVNSLLDGLSNSGGPGVDLGTVRYPAGRVGIAISSIVGGGRLAIAKLIVASLVGCGLCGCRSGNVGWQDPAADQQQRRQPPAGVGRTRPCSAADMPTCGDQCCDYGQTCIANACVIPGEVCFSPVDCPQGQYCETALGPDASQGAELLSDDSTELDQSQCLQARPWQGRCLPLPKPCSEPGCATGCEYRPPTLAQLDPVLQWQWGENSREFPEHIDVWSTPMVGRIHDTNCDGRIDQLDPPAVIVVSGNAKTKHCSAGEAIPSACQTGVLRAIDGATGHELWSLRRATQGSVGFAGMSVAIGDLDSDGQMEIVAVTGEGYLVIVDGAGSVKQLSDKPIPNLRKNGTIVRGFGWGGGLAIADMDGDGHPEVAFRTAVFGTKGDALSLRFNGRHGGAGNVSRALSTFADLDLQPNGDLELLAGNAAYRHDGTVLWHNSALPDGYNAVADFNADTLPDVVLVAKQQVWVLAGADGRVLAGPLKLPGAVADKNGGPPTVADFDGDGQPEIGIAMSTNYVVVEVEAASGQLQLMWSAPNHDLSSSVTGSTVFDFEGDGKAEVVYNDECFLWVYEGSTGRVKFATPTTSFTGTESSLVADVDGDGRAEILMISNGADPSSPAGWDCDVAPWNEADPGNNRPAWRPPTGRRAYRGLTLFGDRSNGWVGTRALWSQHSYHVTNTCSGRDSACDLPNRYGGVPRRERKNWTVPWLNNFRQNVQGEGIFDAPDAQPTISVNCGDKTSIEVFLRNVGRALLPGGVTVHVWLRDTEDGSEQALGRLTTPDALWPGQRARMRLALRPDLALTGAHEFVARVATAEEQETQFHECRADNNEARARPCAVE